MAPETEGLEAQVAQRIRALSTLSDAPGLPDPDWIWVRARIAAHHEAAATALRRRKTGQLWRCGALITGAASLLLAWLSTAEVDFGRQVAAIAPPVTNPVASVVILVLCALAIGFVTGGIILGRPVIATRLRSWGLL